MLGTQFIKKCISLCTSKCTLHLALRSTFKARCKARYKVLLCMSKRPVACGGHDWSLCAFGASALNQPPCHPCSHRLAAVGVVQRPRFFRWTFGCSLAAGAPLRILLWWPQTHRRCDGITLSHRACAVDKPLGSAGGHSRILCRFCADGAQRATESCSVTGGRARHGQGAGRAGAVEADGESYRDALDR